MTKKTISDTITNIDTEYIEKAADYTAVKKVRKPVWMKWVVMAACLCFVVGYVLYSEQSGITSQPSGTPGASTVSTENNRGTVPGTSNPSENQIPVYKIAPLGINDDFIESMQSGLTKSGWSYFECTLSDEYNFVLKGNPVIYGDTITAEEYAEMAKFFLQDSGLGELLDESSIDYEFIFSVTDEPMVTYCYFMSNSAQTGAYIRFIFEDYKCIGEVQAHIYSAEYLDTLELLTLDEALIHAYKVNGEGTLEVINANDYTIQNEELVYINGLPYYRFNGYGINTRSMIEGYALAVDVERSEFASELMKQHSFFQID